MSWAWYDSANTMVLSCSPEDQAILEGEYQRNPKPDKAARASIVSRVSLGEKEVQVRLYTLLLCWTVILMSRFLRYGSRIAVRMTGGSRNLCNHTNLSPSGQAWEIR